MLGAVRPSLRFRSPLIEPDVRISRIRLSDRLHLRAHGVGHVKRSRTVSERRALQRQLQSRTVWSRATGPCDAVSGSAEPEVRLRLRLEIELLLKVPDLFRCFQTHCQSPSPRLPPKHAGSQVPSLRRSYPASTVLWTCPTPDRAVTCMTFGVANPTRSGLPR